MYVVVSLLAPLFIGVTGGDIGMARMGAVQTINAYRAGSHSDLIAIAQIIAFGLAALGSLSLSMADDISLSMTLRLRGNANALNRSAEQNRRVLRENRAAPQPSDVTPEATQRYQVTQDTPIPCAAAPHPETQAQTPPAEPFLSPAAEQVLAAESEARLHRHDRDSRSPVHAPAPASEQAGPPTEQRRKAIWAVAMAKEAAEIRANISNLPPAERNAAQIHLGALEDAANHLRAESTTPPSRHKPPYQDNS